MIELAPAIPREELLKELRELGDPGDPEYAHGRADDLLLLYINDLEITEAFEAITRWYA